MSERRNWDEVNPPRVEASFPTQFPVESSKHPAESLSPLLKVEVAPEERLMEPVVMVSPEDKLRPAEEIPPANVEVAVEEELIEPPICKSPATLRELAKVEEAEA